VWFSAQKRYQCFFLITWHEYGAHAQVDEGECFDKKRGRLLVSFLKEDERHNKIANCAHNADSAEKNGDVKNLLRSTTVPAVAIEVRFI
jgi:hypothetical protein